MLYAGAAHNHLNGMQVDTIVRIIFSCLFVATLIAGIYIIKNFERLLGKDPTVTENSGGRALNKVQVITIWAHILAITAAFALFG